MTFLETPWAGLVRHSTAPGDPVTGIEARLRGARPDVLTFEYVLRGALSRLRIPSARPSARAEGLWKNTCFEAFISGDSGNGYYELNFSPSGQWAVYRFDAYRRGMAPVEVTTPPEVAVRRFDDRLELDATVRLAVARAPKLALSAVVEDASGTLSYWALKHAPGKPDFHHPEGFVLEWPT